MGARDRGTARTPAAEPIDVVVVDDDLPTARVLESLLLSDGCAVRTFTEPRKALESMQDRPPDVLVCDWVMPDMDGPDLLKRVRGTPALSTTYCVLVTAHDDRAKKVTGLLVGADDYLTKPVSKTELLARIRVGIRVRHLERRAMMLATAATLGHEINNPLTAVIGYLELLREQIGKGRSEQALASLGQVEEAAERIREVVERFMSVDGEKTREYLPGSRMLDLRQGEDPPPA